VTTRAAQHPAIAGAVLAANAAASGDKFTNDGKSLLVITNGDGSSHTCTLDDPNTPVPPGSAANNDAVLTVAAGATKAFGPFPTSRFNDADGNVAMTWSATTSMEWSILSVL
jgi:hypothetical protein